MGLEMQYASGQTPLDEDEKEGLLIPIISTRRELDEFEQQNIESAVLWSLKRSFSAENIFTESFIKGLHKRMYGDVWGWAGAFRQSNKNIGVDKWEIALKLRELLGNTIFLIKNQVYEPDEIAIRFKHELVSIHCFPNGNGRHSRLMADIIISKLFGMPVYSWGATDVLKQGNARGEYLKALKLADSGIIEPLIYFARS